MNNDKRFAILGQYLTDLDLDRTRRQRSPFRATLRALPIAAIALAALFIGACGGEVEGTATQSQASTCTLEWPSTFDVGSPAIVYLPFGDTGELETCTRSDDAGDYMCRPPVGDCRYATGPDFGGAAGAAGAAK